MGDGARPLAGIGGITHHRHTHTHIPTAHVGDGARFLAGIGGITHHYLLTGKGPLAFIGGIPNYKSCIEPHIPSLCQ